MQSHGSVERPSFKILLTMNPRSHRVNGTQKKLLTFPIYNHWSKITSKVRETRERGKQSVQTAANLGEKIAHSQRLLQDGAAVRVLNRISREIDDLDVRPQGSRLPRQFETIDARHLDIGDEQSNPTVGANVDCIITVWRRGL